MKKLSTLYSFRRCPYAMRARLAILVSGTQVELREILLKDKPESMLRHSHKGTVPVLVTEQNHVIDESFDIMIWALKNHDPQHWLDIDETAVKRLILENDGSFKQALDQYKYADRYPEQSAESFRERGLVFLNKLEPKLSMHRFLVSDSVTLADVAIFPFVRQFAFVDKPWFDQLAMPHLQQWLEYFLSHELFAIAMKKYPVWQEGDEPIIFGT